MELDGTEDAGTLFWSPDSRYIGFFAARRLKKVAVDGGPPQDIALVVGNKYGATWNSDGVIVFSAENILYQVSDAGGDPQALDVDGTATGSYSRYPAFLADGRRFLYLSGPGEGQGIYVASLDGGPAARILAVASRTLLASGHLFYQREGTPFAHRFDERALALTSEPIRVAQQISYSAGTGNAPSPFLRMVHWRTEVAAMHRTFSSPGLIGQADSRDSSGRRHRIDSRSTSHPTADRSSRRSRAISGYSIQSATS